MPNRNFASWPWPSRAPKRVSPAEWRVLYSYRLTWLDGQIKVPVFRVAREDKHIELGSVFPPHSILQ